MSALGSASTGAATLAASWMRQRIDRATDAFDTAIAAGVTGHVITARNGKRVTLEGEGEHIEFISCSYLGLEQHPALVEAAQSAIHQFGVHVSSARNRLRPVALDALEANLSSIYGGRAVVCFTSTTNAHLGVLPLLGAGALPAFPLDRHGVAFVIERRAHASMQVLRGILEQIGTVVRFDAEQGLEQLHEVLGDVRRAHRTPVVLVDGVGSMGGVSPLLHLHAVTAAHEGILYVDDAHGISMDGAHGEGTAAVTLGPTLPTDVVLAGSLSKAYGGAGGFAVLPSVDDARTVRKHAQGLIFGGSIPLPMVYANVASSQLHLDGEVAVLQRRLRERVAYFDALTNGALVNAGTGSAIRGLRCSTERRTLDAATILRRAGILIIPAFFPTVEQGTGLIRFSVSVLHTDEDLIAAASALGELR